METEKKEAVAVEENEYILWYIEDDILYLTVKKTEYFTLEMAKVCVKDLEEYTKHQPYPCLMNVLEIKGISQKARNFFANEGDSHIKANAMLINSTIMRMIGNFYIMVNQPRKPTRLFTDKEQALEWLHLFIK